jgi:hypothetical protein
MYSQQLQRFLEIKARVNLNYASKITGLNTDTYKTTVNTHLKSDVPNKECFFIFSYRPMGLYLIPRPKGACAQTVGGGGGGRGRLRSCTGTGDGRDGDAARIGTFTVLLSDLFVFPFY